MQQDHRTQEDKPNADGGGVKLTSSNIWQLENLECFKQTFGFTCTGLCYDEDEKLFYVGNIGINNPDYTDKIHSTIEVINEDFTAHNRRIDVGTFFSSMGDIQGISIDYSDNTIWFCSFAENKVRHITKNGQDLGFIEVEQPTGIAYDSNNNTIWVLTYTKLIQFNKDNSIISEYSIQENGQDQLFYDKRNDCLLMTAGTNYHGANYVYQITPQTCEYELVYELEDSYAIEGITVRGDSMYIANDGFYHNAKIKQNQINVYTIDGSKRKDTRASEGY